MQLSACCCGGKERRRAAGVGVAEYLSHHSGGLDKLEAEAGDVGPAELV